jgi:hypothetical protein
MGDLEWRSGMKRARSILGQFSNVEIHSVPLTEVSPRSRVILVRSANGEITTIFFKTEAAFPDSQEFATGPYPKPHESNPRPQTVVL